jgi:phosphonate transport system ATP-binding protein
MAQDPSLLLADEPVSSLDPALAEDILDLLVSLDNLHPFTLLMSLHQPDLAKRYAGRVIAMKGGKVIWDGPAIDLTKTKVEEVYERNDPRRGHNGEPNGAVGDPAPQPGSAEGRALAGS